MRVLFFACSFLIGGLITLAGMGMVIAPKGFGSSSASISNALGGFESSSAPVLSAPEITRLGHLVFNDDFSGTVLNQSKWQTEYLWGRTNLPEAQYYAQDAFAFKDGTLRIQAQKRAAGGMDYTSGLIATHGKFSFTYGYVEMRAKIPAGKGLWPSFWLLADDRASSEIDVMEILGDEPQRVYQTLHWDSPDGQSQEDFKGFNLVDFSKDFHTFAVDWSPQSIIWYVDNVETNRVTRNVPHGSMYLIANLAVGGKWPGYPDNTTQFPAEMQIDYIRVYQR